MLEISRCLEKERPVAWGTTGLLGSPWLGGWVKRRSVGCGKDASPLVAAYLSNGVNLLGPPPVVPVVPGGVVGTTLIPSTELALTGVLEKKDIFPSADENKDVFTAAGGKQRPAVPGPGPSSGSVRRGSGDR